MNRPGGNVTGATRLTTELVPKRLGVLLQLMPGATKIGMLVNPKGVQTALQVKEMQDATRACGLTLHIAQASSNAELDEAFAAIAKSAAAVLVEGSDPYFLDRRKRIVALTIANKIPTIFFERDSVVDGGASCVATRVRPSLPYKYKVPNPASHSRIAFSNTARKTGFKSPGDELTMRRTSAVAFSRSSDSSRSRVSRAISVSWPAADGSTAFGALRRFRAAVLRRRALTRSPALERRLIAPP